MKRKLIDGNYNTEKNPELDVSDKESQNEFEINALKKLGGSIAFIRNGKLYDENN
tara:strand:- start:1200 stop:1364 length:165 start_codon:yes stop_codon:yes gene_type:complete